MAYKSPVREYVDGSKSLHPSDSKEYALVRDWLDRFEYCYLHYRPVLDRLQKLNNAYDNQIDKLLFPTISKMAIPSHFAMVQEALPTALDMVFPDSQKTFGLLPVDEELDLEVVESVELGLNHLVKHRMNAKWATLPTITNAIKCGLGYGAIVPRTVTPPATINKRFVQGGREVASTRVVGLGRPQKTLVYENVGLGEIIVSMDGSDFNGPDAVSHAFRIKMYTEDAFRRLYDRLKRDTEDIEVEGDAEAIISQARDFNFYSPVPIAHIVAMLGGVDVRARNNYDGTRMPIMVPVIQCYGEHEHVWLANGATVILHKKDEYETLHRPLVKATTTVDSNKWHPMNNAEAAQAIASGRHLYANLLMDFIIRAVKPIMVYDKAKFGNKAPQVGINGDVAVDGPVGDALQFPTYPQLNNGHIEYDNLLTRLYSRAVGQPDQLQQPSAGMVRGGLHALESLMNTSSGRQRLASMVLEMGFVKPLGQISLTYMQLMAEGEGVRFVEREYDSDTGKERLDYIKVTLEDINHAYDVTVDTKAKLRGITDLNERLQMWNGVYRDNPFIDQHTALEMTIGDYWQAKHLLPSKQRARQMQEQMELQRQEQEAAAGGPPGGTVEAITEGAGV